MPNWIGERLSRRVWGPARRRLLVDGALCVSADERYADGINGTGITRPRLLCRGKAEAVGHIIPRMCFPESGLPADASCFEENLVPICRNCNQAWVDWDYMGAHHFDAWTPSKVRRWRARLLTALKIAHSRGIKVFLSPSAYIIRKPSRKGFPGPVVLAPPSRPGELHLEILGYLGRPCSRTHRRCLHVYTGNWRQGLGRVRLRDLIGLNGSVISKGFVLNKRALSLLREWRTDAGVDGRLELPSQVRRHLIALGVTLEGDPHHGAHRGVGLR